MATATAASSSPPAQPTSALPQAGGDGGSNRVASASSASPQGIRQVACKCLNIRVNYHDAPSAQSHEGQLTSVKLAEAGTSVVSSAQDSSNHSQDTHTDTLHTHTHTVTSIPCRSRPHQPPRCHSRLCRPRATMSQLLHLRIRSREGAPLGSNTLSGLQSKHKRLGIL